MHRLINIIILLLLAAIPVDAVAKTTKKKTGRKAKTTKVVTAKSSTKVIPNAKPRTSGPWIVEVDAIPAPDGLEGRNIALWASHGRYYESSEDRWTWQRGRLMGTVEDLFSMSYVNSFLAPMLEDAGATVIMPRERDTSEIEVIIDADASSQGSFYTESNGKKDWRDSEKAKGFGSSGSALTGSLNPFRTGNVREVPTVNDKSDASSAMWTAQIPEKGEYALYVSYASLPNSTTDAIYRVNSSRGIDEFIVNQTMGGGTWVYLGTFPFDEGETPVVELLNLTGKETGTVVTADAVRIGGGVGDVIRGKGDTASSSGYPRFTEGARYWLQYAGIPSSVYSVTSGDNDYEDDFKARGMWVNYLAGGSKYLPGQDGLGIPVDLSFALHTDAGTTDDSSTTIGTLPIVSTAGSRLGDGRSRQTSVTYANMVTDQIIDDIWTLVDPMWTRRKLRDKQYHEAREPLVPAMLLELLSHQNYADMTRGLDPAFRFVVSRAIYKGILKYLHKASGTPYVVTPLPVSDFSITGSPEKGEYTLRWQSTPDKLEATAVASYYIVYERKDDGAFTELAITDDNYLTVTPEDDRIYSYKVIAANKGGVSFPSEILSLCRVEGSKPQVTIVNGFTRVSGPEKIYTDEEIGFDYEADMGVPYLKDLSFTGAQTEFRPGSPWISNDAPGHGASRASHETMVIAGNTFDYPYIHGTAIREAGYSFISTSVSAFVKSTDTPEIVDIIFGKQKEVPSFVNGRNQTAFKPFTTELKNRMILLAEGGTDFLVSGSYIASDLFDNSNSDPSVSQSDRLFAQSILGIEWRQSNATITGKVKEIKGRFPQFNGRLTFTFNQTLSPDCYAVESPESFVTASSVRGCAILRYCENDYVAGTAIVTPTHKAVVIGFPLETVIDRNDLSKLMGNILGFFTAPLYSGVDENGRIRVVPGILFPSETPVLIAESWADFQSDPRLRDPALKIEDENYSRRQRRRNKN